MKPVTRTAALALSLFAAPAFSAGELQGQLNVQITIGTGCTVTNGTAGGSSNTFGSLSFGDYNDLANLIDGRSFGSAGGSSFGLQCSLGTDYSVALSAGQNASGSQRRMINAGEFVAYNLYQDSSRTEPWGDGGATGTVLSGTGTGANEEMIVYGRVPSQDTPSPGTYTDTVQVTIAW
ncbi:MAG: spore coat protein [Gammaproteobacteria bacterium HGW-Gammaproteobacteria-12]|nr:MAG: spore coat protein [Gammaproteobacteria bacterium HGW-Gammaproteobacteria-12]